VKRLDSWCTFNTSIATAADGSVEVDPQCIVNVLLFPGGPSSAGLTLCVAPCQAEKSIAIGVTGFASILFKVPYAPLICESLSNSMGVHRKVCELHDRVLQALRLYIATDGQHRDRRPDLMEFCRNLENGRPLFASGTASSWKCVEDRWVSYATGGFPLFVPTYATALARCNKFHREKRVMAAMVADEGDLMLVAPWDHARDAVDEPGLGLQQKLFHQAVRRWARSVCVVTASPLPYVEWARQGGKEMWTFFADLERIKGACRRRVVVALERSRQPWTLAFKLGACPRVMWRHCSWCVANGALVAQATCCNV
jgi:hypothetical protein